MAALTDLGAVARPTLQLVHLDNTNWRLRSACRDDPDAMYPDDKAGAINAKRICAACPVRTACLEDALSRREPYGVWGGLSFRERHQVRRQRTARAAAAVCRKGLHPMVGDNVDDRDGMRRCVACRLASRRAAAERVNAGRRYRRQHARAAA